jgi:hypothetical protein
MLYLAAAIARRTARRRRSVFRSRPLAALANVALADFDGFIDAFECLVESDSDIVSEIGAISIGDVLSRASHSGATEKHIEDIAKTASAAELISETAAHLLAVVSDTIVTRTLIGISSASLLPGLTSG